jgi:hypothetical protein
LDLVRTLNASLREDGLDDARLKRAYDRLWPELEGKLQNVPSVVAPVLKRTADDKTDEVSFDREKPTAGVTGIAETMADAQHWFGTS